MNDDGGLAPSHYGPAEWEAIIEHSSDIVTVLDEDGTVLFQSPAVERILGYGQEELVGDDVFQYIHPADMERTESVFSELLESQDGTTKRAQFRFRDADSSWVWLETIGSNREDSGIGGYVLNSRDITEQKEQEAALRERNKELEALHYTAKLFGTENVPVESVFKEFVEELPSWFQYPEHTEIRVCCGDIDVASKGFETTDVEISATVDTREGTSVEVEVGLASGNEGADFLDEERRLIDTLAVYLGETLDRRSHSEELSLFKRAVEEVGHAVMITDSDGSIEYVNPAFEVQTGFSKTEAIGRTPRLLKSGRHDPAFYGRLWDTILRGEEWNEEMVNQRKDGSLYYVNQVISPILNESNEVTHFVSIESEITDLRLREQQLDVHNRVLRHNLRNSLNVIEGESANIRRATDDPTKIKSTETIQNQVDTLLSISNKSAESRKLVKQTHVTSSEYDLADVLHTLEDDVQKQYDSVEFDFDYPSTVIVRGGDQLSLALEEAVENAIVHNDHSNPFVSISVNTPTESSHERFTEVVISDNGPGIPENERIAVDRGRETPLEHGTGIGLWNINWAVTRLGGEVRIESRTPRGTSLVLELPTPSDST